MNKKTLKPCPFCNGEAQIVDWISDGFIPAMYTVSCKHCGLWKHTTEEAVEHWNTRKYIGWNPIEEGFPQEKGFYLISFANGNGVDVGRWEEDEEGGAFYIGDSMESFTSHGLFVNAWMPFPKPYKEDEQ